MRGPSSSPARTSWEAVPRSRSCRLTTSSSATTTEPGGERHGQREAQSNVNNANVGPWRCDMSDQARVRQQAERVRELVASAVRTRVKDPRLGMITITDARITGDLRDATVFYTVL